ncbi:uncharacterized protein FTOL_13809 [Fusarium torulosum]|uniref:Uncharacterized protein n=1 Tax=Fusarium torulosum TaxID=33205 RepID=A0AAE8MMV4_9HYPO|nr:uncharacterized protein FTOL_13809 [Fusarium torulosum]
MAKTKEQMTEELQPYRFTEPYGHALLDNRHIKNRRRRGRQVLGQSNPVNSGKRNPLRARQSYITISGGH